MGGLGTLRGCRGGSSWTSVAPSSCSGDTGRTGGASLHLCMRRCGARPIPHGTCSSWCVLGAGGRGKSPSGGLTLLPRVVTHWYGPWLSPRNHLALGCWCRVPCGPSAVRLGCTGRCSLAPSSWAEGRAALRGDPCHGGCPSGTVCPSSCWPVLPTSSYLLCSDVSSYFLEGGFGVWLHLPLCLSIYWRPFSASWRVPASWHSARMTAGPGALSPSRWDATVHGRESGGLLFGPPRAQLPFPGLHIDLRCPPLFLALPTAPHRDCPLFAEGPTAVSLPPPSSTAPLALGHAWDRSCLSVPVCSDQQR